MTIDNRPVRQGDVLVVPTANLVEGDRMNRHMDHATLAHGEVTGHFHGIRTPNAVHFRPDDAPDGCFSLKVEGGEVELLHTNGSGPAEHDPVKINPGNHIALVPYEYSETRDAVRVVD